MEIKFEGKQLQSIINKKQKEIDKITKNALNEVVDYATTQAQNGFNNFIGEASTDDPNVTVKSSSIKRETKSAFSRKISCYGSQVLYIEFGVGLMPYNETEARMYRNVMLDSNGVPISLRPHGIDPIGTRGKGYGSQDKWIRPSTTGEPQCVGEGHVHIKDKYGNDTGKVRTDVVWTEGHRPARALYRAVGMAIKRLLKQNQQVHQTSSFGSSRLFEDMLKWR